MKANLGGCTIGAGLALFAGSCAPPPPPPPPAPRPVVRPPAPPLPAPPADWRDAPLTAGSWHWSPGRAWFGGAAPRATLTCSAGTIALTIAGAAPGPIVVTTSSTVRAIGSATLPARDPLLDAIAFSRGRFALAAPGVTLTLPAWPEVARVIDDCR